VIRTIELLINNLVMIGGKVTSMPYHKLHRTTSFMASSTSICAMLPNKVAKGVPH
jgi:hypothetical protein